MRERTDPGKIAMLRRIPGLDEAAEVALAGLAVQLDVVDVQPGRCLLRQGQGTRGLLLVISGRASVHRDGRRIADIGAGAVIGEMATRSGGERTATVIAETPMRLLVANPASAADVLDHLDRLAPSHAA